MNYAGGVFAGCSANPVVDHAVTVVGYGTENGVDFWLIKNSWGAGWGEKGFIKLKRGVNMCGIGPQVAVPICTKVDGPTEQPPTTKKPCVDAYANCPELAKTLCYAYTTTCQKSCGLCEGMTPAKSNTCYNKYSNCDEWKDSCTDDAETRADCMITCGTC